MISYLGSLFNSVLLRGGRGSAGRCRCVWGALAVFWPGSQKFWRPLPGCGVPFPHAVSSPGGQRFSGLSPGVACLFPPRRAARAARGLCVLSPAAAHLFPPWRAAQAVRGLCGLSTAPFLSVAPARTASQASVSLRIGTEACLQGERGLLLWS